MEVLGQAVQVYSFSEWVCFPLQRPVDTDLSRSATVLLRDFGDNRICQNVQVLLLSLADAVVRAAANCCVALDQNIELSVDIDQGSLLEVGMHFNLIYRRMDLTACNKVKQDWD